VSQGSRQLARTEPDLHPDRGNLFVRHDDAEREFDCDAGSEDALVAAEKEHWTVITHEERLGGGVEPPGA
jgi:hypothetical protein